MNGLTGTRVVIVDDEETEALPIIRELSKRGISSVYYKDAADLPKSESQKPFGIRLAILDMDLVGGAVSEKSIVSTLLGYLRKLLRTDNGPYGVLIWTKHVNVKNLFEDEVFKVTEIPNPVFLACVSKYECKNRKGDFDLNKVAREISKSLRAITPLFLLQKWEETNFISATQVTNQLASLSERDAPNLDEWRKSWKTEFLQLMRAMANAEAGKQLSNEKVLGSLYNAMNPLHSDRMESNVTNLRKSLSGHAQEILTFPPTTNKEAKAKLNSMLHLAVDNIDEFYSGNVYLKAQLGSSIPTANKLLDDFIEGNDQNAKKQNKLLLISLVKSVGVEINAACDHSQDNIRVARFLAGLLVPEDKINKIKKAEFIYRLGPIFFRSKSISASKYYLCFSARYLVTLEPNVVVNIHPMARLRGQAFSDLQAWFARQSARPGMLLLN